MKVTKEGQTVTLRIELTADEVAQLRAEIRDMDPPYATNVGGGAMGPRPWQNPPRWPLALGLFTAMVERLDPES